MAVFKLTKDEHREIVAGLGLRDSFKIDWEKPVITEKIVADNIEQFCKIHDITYIAYPWASLLNLHKIYLHNISFSDFLRPFLNDIITIMLLLFVKVYTLENY